MDKKKYIEDLAFETYGVTNCAVPFNFYNNVENTFGSSGQYLYIFDMNISIQYVGEDVKNPFFQLTWPNTSLPLNFYWIIHPVGIHTAVSAAFSYQNLVSLSLNISNDTTDIACQCSGYKVQIS